MPPAGQSPRVVGFGAGEERPFDHAAIMMTVPDVHDGGGLLVVVEAVAHRLRIPVVVEGGGAASGERHAGEGSRIRLTRLPCVANLCGMPSGGLLLDGQRLRQVRENQGKSIRGYAAELGISYAFLSQVELGRRRAMPPMAKKIAEGLGLTIEEIRA